MANKKKEIHFKLTDDDFKAFGTYRVLYTQQGRSMVRRQRLTYLLTAVAISALFTVFKVDVRFTRIMYFVSLILLISGLFFAEKMVLRQQEKAINASADSAERVHAAENIIRFDDKSFTTTAGNDVQEFDYDDIMKVDLTEEAIYVWMSETMIMPLPLHAFRDMSEMKEYSKFLKTKVKEARGAEETVEAAAESEE